jgi:hypothetical protein
MHHSYLVSGDVDAPFLSCVWQCGCTNREKETTRWQGWQLWLEMSIRESCGFVMLQTAFGVVIGAAAGFSQ